MMKRLYVLLQSVFCTIILLAQTDVDTRIAVNEQRDPNTFVLIISNENYKYEQPVPFALNDGAIFKLYCEKTLGIPSDNIKYQPDASLNDMQTQFWLLEKKMSAFDGDARAVAAGGRLEEGVGVALVSGVFRVIGGLGNVVLDWTRWR